MSKPFSNPLRIAVIGLGPVGSTLAAHFVEAGAHVIVCDIDRDKINLIKKSGIHLRQTIEKDIQVSDICYGARELANYDLDLISISVKTPYLKLVIDDLAEIKGEHTFVMSAQNGLDNEMEVADTFGEKVTLRMVINYAGNMIDKNTVRVTFFNPPNYVAPLHSHGKEIATKITTLLDSVNLPTVIPDDIRVYTWEKAILNASLSPVCALSRRTMEGVMATGWGVNLVEEILKESINIARAEGIDLGEDFLSYCIQYLNKGGRHKPSMLIDIENNLPTEIDYLNGSIVAYGEKHSLPTPVNQTITTLINLLEHKGE